VQNFKHHTTLIPNHKARAKSSIDKKHAPENPQMQTVYARNLAPVQIQLWLEQKRKPLPLPSEKSSKNRKKKKKREIMSSFAFTYNPKK